MLLNYYYLSNLMRKPTISKCETKCVDQLRSNCEAYQRLRFASRIVQYLFFLSPKFQASSHLPCLYSSVSVGPVGKPHGWFSDAAAHFIFTRCAYGADCPCVCTAIASFADYCSGVINKVIKWRSNDRCRK